MYIYIYIYICSKALPKLASPPVMPKATPIAKGVPAVAIAKAVPVAAVAKAFSERMPKAPPLVDPHAASPKRGQWWLTRTGCKATCATCKGEIKPYEFRLTYTPLPSAALMAKAPSYAAMFDKVSRFYHHLAKDCLPCPLMEDNVQEVFHRGSIFVDVRPLPKKMKETSSDLATSIEEATRLSMQSFSDALHRVDDA